MIKVELKDVVDVLTQMYDDVKELYDGETIYSLSLNIAINTLEGAPVKPYYVSDMF